MPRPVSIVTGSGQGLGSGHLARMRVLERELFARGLTVQLFASAATIHAADPSGLTASVVVLDARDVDPRPLRSTGPVIALDNRHGSRAGNRDPGLIFYDTIPHPQLDLKHVLERTLIAPELREARRVATVQRDQNVLVYCPDSIPEGLMEFLTEHRRNHSGARIVVTGGGTGAREFPDSPVADLILRERLDPTGFYRELRNARFVLAYFGMTILEAWFAGAVPVLFSIASPVHDLLSEDLERRAGIVFLRGAADFAGLSARTASLRVPPGGPGGQGYELLVSAVEALARF